MITKGKGFADYVQGIKSPEANAFLKSKRNQSLYYGRPPQSWEWSDVGAYLKGSLSQALGNPVGIVSATTANEIRKAVEENIGRELSDEELAEIERSTMQTSTGVLKESVKKNIVEPVSGFVGDILGNIKWFIIAAIVLGVVVLVITRRV